MRTIHIGLSLFASEALRQAALPLFVAGEVEALEWSFDPGWSRPEPEWVSALLDAYAEAGRLYGHGVHFSPTSVQAETTGWLARVKEAMRRRTYQQVTEHWGFSRAGGLRRSAPLPLPACEASVRQAVRAMRMVEEAARGAERAPVGLENLALAFSEQDVDAQPVMLAGVLDELDGVLLLDLHNLWCQAVNYRRDARALAARYPLARVRQLHVAGGGWSSSAFGAAFRRDTHDALVPDEVLELVSWIIPRCPALEVVIVERLPETLATEEAQVAWRSQWRELAAIVQRAVEAPMAEEGFTGTNARLDRAQSIEELGRYQDALIRALRATPDPAGASAAKEALLAHPDVAPFRDQVTRFDLRALEVACALTARWGVADDDAG